MLSPAARHIAEERWSKLGHAASLAHEPWPTYDESMITEDQVELPVQIGGKVRGKVTVPADADAAQIEQAALADEKIKAALAGKTIRKVADVPGKIIHLVAN